MAFSPGPPGAWIPAKTSNRASFEPPARARLRSHGSTRLTETTLFTHKFCYRPEFSKHPFGIKVSACETGTRVNHPLHHEQPVQF